MVVEEEVGGLLVAGESAEFGEQGAGEGWGVVGGPD